MPNQQHLAIIGGGMAATRFAELLARKQAPFAITIYQEENCLPYNRIMLSPVLAGEKSLDDIVLKDDTWFAQHAIEFRRGVVVERIDTHSKELLGHSASDQANSKVLGHYDHLVFASGSTGRKLAIPGADHQDVHVFRTHEDVNAMLSYPRTDAHGEPTRCAVIGAGLLGLEAANALACQGYKVTVIHHANSILNRQLDAESANYLTQHYRSQHGDAIEFMMSAATQDIIAQKDGLQLGLKISHDARQKIEKIDCRFVVMAVGVQPNVSCAKRSGLEVNRGICVDKQMHTSQPNVYAIGECTEFEARTFGLVAPVYDQAEVLAAHLLHQAEYGAPRQDNQFEVRFTPTKLKVSGVNLFSAGDVADTQDCEMLVYEDRLAGIYKRLAIKDDCIVNIILYGDILDGNWYFELMESKQSVAGIKDLLIFGKGFCQHFTQANSSFSKSEQAA